MKNEIKFNPELAKNLMKDKGKRYKKKPIVVSAVQIDKPFSVPTMEGVMSGKANDYLIRGIKGEFYPCDKEIFEASYEGA